MLTSQMVGTHLVGRECLRRAAHPIQNFEERGMALTRAQKLIVRHREQLETFNKRLRKGLQRVTLKHLHEAKFDHAIVGNVETVSNRDAGAKPPCSNTTWIMQCH